MAFKYVKRTSKKAKARKGESYVAKGKKTTFGRREKI